MTEKLYNAIYDCETKTETLVEFTPEEYARAELAAQAYLEMQATRQAEAEALAALKSSAKAKLIAGEPLTAEEAETIVL